MIRFLEAYALDLEQPVMAIASQHLGALLSASSGRPCLVDLRLHHATDSMSPGDGTAVILSPMCYVCDDSPLDVVGEIIGARLAAIAGGHAVIAITTIFALADRRDPALIRRIRAINLLTLGLSQRTGILVADVDRELSLLGGRGLRADYRVESLTARERAGQLIGTVLFEGSRGTKGHP